MPRTQSPSRRKPKKARLPVLWLRTTTGEDFVSYGRVTKSGVTLTEPTSVSSYGSLMMLTPYGIFGRDRVITIKTEHVLHAGPASEVIRDLYEKTVGEAWDHCVLSFEKTVKETGRVVAEGLSSATRELEGEIDPDAEVKKTLGVPEEFSRGSRARSVDNLVKLAERAGKGKSADPVED